MPGDIIWPAPNSSESCLKRESHFHPAPIRQKWQEHQTRNSHFYLWDILMFKAWLNR
jgi:asparagine synthase (glutamine-hydrolysing)